MKAVYIAMMAAAGVVMAGQAQADEALAKAKNCMSCHAVDKKLVGPAYKDVAAKYKGDGKAAATLAAETGGGGGALLYRHARGAGILSRSWPVYRYYRLGMR